MTERPGDQSLPDDLADESKPRDRAPAVQRLRYDPVSVGSVAGSSRNSVQTVVRNMTCASPTLLPPALRADSPLSDSPAVTRGGGV
jgi:hypothetical protein